MPNRSNANYSAGGKIRPVARGGGGGGGRRPHRPHRLVLKVQLLECSRLMWRMLILTTFSLYRTPLKRKLINLFIEKAISFHPTIKFAAEILENESIFLFITSYKGERLKNESILDIPVPITSRRKPYAHFTSSHPIRRKKRFLRRKLLDFWEQTFLRQHSKRTCQI